MRLEDLTRLAPPPRDLPLEVRLFVGLVQLEGAMFFVILSALLASAVAPNTDWKSLLFMKGVEGTVGRVTNAEERGWLEGKQKVWRVRFEFDSNGRKETGDSHFVGSRPKIGDEVRVEWPVGFPRITRIEDARTGPLHVGALAVMFFPLFALMMAQASWRTGSGVVRGMRDGVRSAPAKEPGLADPATGEILARLEAIPHAVEPGLDGGWMLESASRMTRPAVMAGLAGASVALLAWTLFEMGNQL